MKLFTSNQLSAVLGVRAPLLMLDRAQICDDGSAIARKAVSMSEPVFQGHFPGHPILPGVLQVTAMTQLAKFLFLKTVPIQDNAGVVLKSLRRLKFRKPVLPGMVMTVEAKITERRAEGEMDFQVSCNTEQGLASAGTVTLAWVNPDEYDTPRMVAGMPESPFATEIAGAPVTDIVGLMKVLPHRPPFLLIDRAFNIGGEQNRIFGYKNLSGNDMMLAGMPHYDESFLEDDFDECFLDVDEEDGEEDESKEDYNSGASPDNYPFPLMIEAAAQLGCAHVLSQPGNAGKLGIFLCIDEAKFYQHAKIGDQLLIAGQCDFAGRGGTATAELWVADQKIGDMALKFILMEANTNA